MNYKEAKALFESARSPHAGKPVDNNTRLFLRPNGSYALQLHNTDILTFRRDGAVVYNTGGWRTVTTKQRMNAYGPARVWSERGTWWIAERGTWRIAATRAARVYAEGCRVLRDGRIVGAGNPGTVLRENKLRRQVAKFSQEFIRKLYAREIAKPSGGDCWGCCMRDVKTGKPMMTGKDHLLSHLDESHYVPSLLVNAFEAMGASQAVKHDAGVLMGMFEGPRFFRDDDSWGRLTRKQMVRVLRRYMLRELGLAS